MELWGGRGFVQVGGCGGEGAGEPEGGGLVGLAVGSC